MKTTKFKGLIAALLSASLIFGAGCKGGNNAETTTTSASAAETTTTVTTAQTEENNEATVSAQSETAEETTVQQEEASKSAITPAVWKATDPESGNSIYLMGTFHALPEGTYPLPDYIEEIYANSDGIAVEYDISKLSDPEKLDMAAVQEYQNALMYIDGSLLSDHLSEETYNAVKAFADEKLGGWNPLYDYYNVGFWVSNIASFQVAGVVGFDFEQGVDRYFIAKAQNDGKTVTDIEELSAQTGAMTAYSDKLGDYVIAENIKNIDDTETITEQLKALYGAWASGDVDSFETLNEEAEGDEELPEELEADFEQYYDKLYTSRNKQMAERAAEFIKNGDNVFFLVGFAHYAGEQGIPALLTDMGITVEKVY